jgi:hypothetical protein
VSDQIASFDLGPVWRRALLVVPVAVAVICVWFAARWCLGNELAAWAPEVEGMSRASMAAAATRLAPDDPQAHFTLARLGEMSFLPEELPAAVARYERAAALSPNDYRLWVELGRARSAAGDTGGAERALRRATELAPNYPGPRWHLGNLLLRGGRTEEAFAELRRAGDADPATYRAQVFNMAWGAFGGDTARLRELAGDSAASRAALADYLVGRGRLDDALALWREFDAANLTAEHAAAGTKLREALAALKRFHDALSVERVLLRSTSGAGVAPEIDRVTNGGFEEAVGPAGRNLFEWQVTPVAGAQLNLDAGAPRGGARSLRVLFESGGALDFKHVSQLVAVRPSSRYRLEYFFRTDGLKSTSTLRTVVADAADAARPLASSDPLPMGATDGWRQAAVEFATGPRTEAVTVTVRREPCAEAVCPIFGKVWYDDFNLQRTGGGAADPRAGQRGDAGRAR